MHAKYEVSTSNGSKVIANVKFDNKQTNKQTDKQTDKQTNRQDKNNMPPIIRSGGIKMPLMMPNNLEMWFSEKGNVYFENSEEVGVGGGPVDINNANVKMLVTNICD